MQLRTLIAQPPNDEDKDHSLRKVFYAINVSDQEKQTFEERYAVDLINGYGQSETMTLLTVSPVASPRRWPSIGLPSPGRTLLLLDEEGKEVATGEVGEICVRGERGRSIMLGYYKDEQSTAETIRGDLLHTGDNAYADEQGYLYFFDRKKDMIKRAGENVSAIEVESVLVDHPLIAEAAIIGIADPIRDEAVAAVVVVADGADLSEADITAYCKERLSRFKVPTVVAFETELPKTSIGKVRKDELRKKLEGAASA
jgi:carnitine-CoA ligase